MNRIPSMSKIFLAALLTAQQLWAAEVHFPNTRHAYYAKESIELAVTGLEAGQTGKVTFIPQTEGMLPVELQVSSDKSIISLPPFSLAPGKYDLTLDGGGKSVITISAGAVSSPLLVSETIAINELDAGGANFILGNSASWGLYTPQGLPDPAPRGRKSSGFTQFERAIEMDKQTIVYMYWTGYVTHKPFGSEKSWGNAQVQEAMRLLNFSNAQQLERFEANLHAVGTLDEPGLSWGPTPAGGMASGFPAPDEKEWWETRGWKWTLDIGNQSDADWMKYMTVRCDIMRESNALAKADFKSVMPEVPFATDLYAPHAVMDGTDPLNQAINDIPTSHVFVDWGISRFGTYSGLYLEKCDAPHRKIAHATNGQLFSKAAPQPNQTDAYRVTMNSMLMAGLYSNWWLNPTGMKPQDLKSVNDPAAKIGALTKAMEVTGHPIAVLWSFTEVAMRQKDVAIKESTKKTGEQIKLMIASMPESHAEGGVTISAYSVGQNYKDQVLHTHSAVSRAGYAAHIIHERVLAEQLKNYKVLVIPGQTFDFPAEVRKTISDWQQGGGKLIVDAQTTVKFDGASTVDTKIVDWGFKWSDLFQKSSMKVPPFPTAKEASLYLTNYFMDTPQRDATPPIKAALKQAGIEAVFESESVTLAAERHQAGEGSLLYVLNVNDVLPTIGDNDTYLLYNFASQQTALTLKGIASGAVVYAIEGKNHEKISKLEKPEATINASFEAGEMKMFLVSPREPEGIAASGEFKGGQLTIVGALQGVKMPWPLAVTVTAPDGRTIYKLWRSTNAEGQYTETLAIGTNAVAGEYKIAITSEAGNLSTTATAHVETSTIQPHVMAEAVRVFRSEQLQAFLKNKPEIVIAIGNDKYNDAAKKLVDGLSSAGIKASIKNEMDVIRKVHYPRVWNPNAMVFKAGSAENAVPDMTVEKEVTISTDAAGVLTITDKEGKPVADWMQPNTLATLAGEGWVDYSGDQEMCYESGVKIFVDKERQRVVLNAKPEKTVVTEAFRARWSKPWTTLVTHVGAYQLRPQMPEAYTTDSHLIVLGDSTTSELVKALQASEVVPQVVDAAYPGAGKSIVTLVMSPFAVEKNVIVIAASDDAGLAAGLEKVTSLAK